MRGEAPTVAEVLAYESGYERGRAERKAEVTRLSRELAEAQCALIEERAATEHLRRELEEARGRLAAFLRTPHGKRVLSALEQAYAEGREAGRNEERGAKGG